MISIRRGTFETNSSSTHSICIPSKESRTPFNEGEITLDFTTFINRDFGWEWDITVDTTDYFMIALIHLSDSLDSVIKSLKHVVEVLTERGVNCIVDYDLIGKVYHDDFGYIDHVSLLEGFLNWILNDDDILFDFLVYGYVITGNDNEDTPDYIQNAIDEADQNNEVVFQKDN